MDPIKEEVQYIKDTPIRIIHDSEISMFRGRLQPHWHEEIEIDCVLNGNVNYIINGTNYKVSQGEIHHSFRLLQRRDNTGRNQG